MTLMHDLSRRALLGSLVAASGARVIAPASAQTDAPQAAAGAPAPFGFPDVVKRARDLAAAPFDGSIPALPDGLANLDFDAWRDIRFKSDKPLLGQDGANFRLELFHLGHLYKRPVVVNVLRDGIPAPIPYAANLFDYGRTKVDNILPINLGFAGFRLRFPINAPARLGRGDRVSRRELFPLSRPRPALRPVGARSGDQRQPESQGGVSVLSRILDRDAGRRGRARRHLCAARQRIRRPAPSASTSLQARKA